MKEKAIQRFVYCYEQILIRTLSWGAQFQYKGIPVHIFPLQNLFTIYYETFQVQPDNPH